MLEADIILHVRDISHEDAEAQERDVDAVLRQLGIDPDAGQRILEVWNKIDRFDPEERENLRNIAARRPPERPCFLVSAETGEGIDALLAAIEDRLAATRTTLDLSIDASDGAGISWLHRNSEVLTKELHDGRFDMTVRVDETKRDIVGQPVRCGAARGVIARSSRTANSPCNVDASACDDLALCWHVGRSAPFASFHSASISASEAPSSERPLAASARSI